MNMGLLMVIPALVLPAPLVVLAPDNAAEALFRQARDLRYAQRWFEATQAYRTLLREFPSSPRAIDARYWLASSLEQDQRWDEAAEAYTEFLAKYPDQRMLGKEARLNRVRCWGIRQWDSPTATAGLASSLSDEREEVRIAAALQLALFYFASPPWPGLPAAASTPPRIRGRAGRAKSQPKKSRNRYG